MSLSRRYAKALLEIAQRTNSIELTAGRLDDLQQTLKDNPDLHEALHNPVFPLTKRRSVLEAVSRAIQAPEHLIVFLGFLFDKDRINILPELALVFRRLADDQTGTVRGEIISATPLTDGQQAQLQAALNKATSREVKFTVRQDASLLGGTVARIGDVVFDGSVRTQLQQMKATLLEN